jgi:chorismate synthase
MMSIPATKGFEIGCGFSCSEMLGSQHNDTFASGGEGLNRIQPITNHAGGTLGGITSGANIRFRVAFKPPSTISQKQSTVTLSGDPSTLEAKGRHDPCVVHRAVPIVEAMASLVLLDAVLQQRRLGI